MAEDPKFETPFEDPFENQVVKDPFVEEHFGGQSSNFSGNAAGAAWSETLPDSTAVLVDAQTYELAYFKTVQRVW